MVHPDPFQRPPVRWAPWWATALSGLVLLLSAALMCCAMVAFYLLVSGAQYGIFGLPVGMVLLLVAFVVGGPTVSYLASRRQRSFVTAMVVVGVVVALLGLLVFR